MPCSCSFIILTIRTDSQMQALGLYSGGLIFRVLWYFEKSKNIKRCIVFQLDISRRHILSCVGFASTGEVLLTFSHNLYILILPI